MQRLAILHSASQAMALSVVISATAGGASGGGGGGDGSAAGAAAAEVTRPILSMPSFA